MASTIDIQRLSSSEYGTCANKGPDHTVSLDPGVNEYRLVQENELLIH